MTGKTFQGIPGLDSISLPAASEDEPAEFLIARVSQDTRVIEIDHPTEADWNDVLAAHIALRDRLNIRIAEQQKCPHAPAQAAEVERAVQVLRHADHGLERRVGDAGDADCHEHAIGGRCIGGTACVREDGQCRLCAERRASHAEGCVMSPAHPETATAEQQREVLEAAWRKLRGDEYVKTGVNHFYRFQAMLDAEAYLDAALLLLPETAANLTILSHTNGWAARFNDTSQVMGIRAAREQIARWRMPPPGGGVLRDAPIIVLEQAIAQHWMEFHCTTAATPALALCAAIMRAKETNNDA